MTDIFLGIENMNHQLSNALSTMFLRRLVMFLHFDIYAVANPQKKRFSPKSVPQLDFLHHISRKNVTLDTGRHGYRNFLDFFDYINDS